MADDKLRVPLATYLFTRLHQLGVRGVLGVPGDFNLVALDYLEQSGLQWVGNCNELNAGYAADGYARIKGISAVVTTFGVGELSTVNAIAGSFAEYVPVVHIVGTPSTISQQDGMLLHHTLGNGDFTVFANIFSKVTIAQTNLNDIHTAPGEIDRVLRECYLKARPVYIQLPTDMVEKECNASGLKSKLQLEDPTNNKDVEDYVVAKILDKLYAAKRPIILVDGCVPRHRVLEETDELIRHSQLPTYVSPLGKSAVNESYPNYSGLYAGDGSHDSVRRAVESADLVLSIGAIKSDFNTTGFTYRISALNTIDLHSTYCVLDYGRFDGIGMKGVIQRLVKELDVSRLVTGKDGNHPGHAPKGEQAAALGEDEPRKEFDTEEGTFPKDAITHRYLWPRVSDFFAEGDIIVSETGTSAFGMWETTFPAKVVAISQVLWGSIGYTVGSAMGAALAAKELGQGQRTILFIGDGSFQLTAQELSVMIRSKLNVIIFLIENNGYTIEKFIHGEKADYNQIARWDYSALTKAFGGTPESTTNYEARTTHELEEVLKNETVINGQGVRFITVFMPESDAPRALKKTAKASADLNAKN